MSLFILIKVPTDLNQKTKKSTQFYSNIPHMGKIPPKSCQARQSVVGWSSQSFRHHLPTHLTRLKIIANMPLIKAPHHKLHTHLSQARLSVVDQAISPLVERRAGSTKASSTWLVRR